MRRNVVALALAAGFSRLGYFICLGIIGRAVGVAEFGRFSFVLTVFLAFSIIGNFGLENLTVRTIARSRQELGPFLGAALRLRLVAVPVAVALAAALAWREPRSLWLVVALMAYGLANAAVLFDVALFRGIEEMQLQTLVLGGQALLSVLLVAGAMWISPSPEAGAWAYVAATVVAVGVAAALRHNRGLTSAKATGQSSRHLVRQNTPFAVSLLGLLVFDRAALVLLAFFDSDEAIGWFGAAYVVVIGVANLPLILINAAFPRLSRVALTMDGAELQDLIVRVIAAIAVLGVMTAGGVYLLADTIISVGFGSGFEPGASSLRNLSFAIPLLFVIVALNGVVQAVDAQAEGAKAVWLGLLIGLPISVALIATGGFANAAGGYFAPALTTAVGLGVVVTQRLTHRARPARPAMVR